MNQAEFDKLSPEEKDKRVSAYVEVLKLKRATGTQTFKEEASLREVLALAMLVREDMSSKYSLDERVEAARTIQKFIRFNGMWMLMEILADGLEKGLSAEVGLVLFAERLDKESKAVGEKITALIEGMKDRAGLKR